MLPPKVGFIVGLFVQAILYGMYIATLVHGVRFHLYEDEGRNISNRRWAMTIVVIVIFMFTTIDLGIMVPMVLERGPRTLPVLSATIESITIHIVDAVLIYRCWTIYQSWSIVCLPLVLWCSTLVCMSFDVYYQSMAIGQPVPEQVIQFRFAFFACHVVTNVFATFAICYRILSATSSNRIRKLGYMFACSGVLFMLTSILNLVFGFIGFTPKLLLYQVTFNAINFSMAGITFNLILMYVADERAKSADDSFSNSGQSPTKIEKVLSALRFPKLTAVPHGSSCDSPDYTDSPWNDSN